MKSWMMTPAIAAAAAMMSLPDVKVVDWFAIAMLVIQILTALGILKPREPKK